MSAREIMTFIMHFPLIRDLVPPDDEVWNFQINFIEIIDIILCFFIMIIYNNINK